MKIGKFSLENNVSIDSIRHYMELGLIMPEKIGGHYDFDDRCRADLEDILSLKEMEFTLNEIRSIFQFKKLGKLTSYQEIEIYKELYINKHDKITKHIEELHRARLKLEDKIKEMSQNKSKSPFTIGIDISALSILKCLKCSGNLTLDKGHITNNQVMDGILRCGCGNQYKIAEGILIGENKLEHYQENFNYSDNMTYIAEYINETDSKYLENIYKGLNWTHKKLKSEELRNKRILDLGSGFGFLTREIYDDLPQDSLYIAIDHDIERHRFLKKMLENAKYPKKMIFICCDFLKIPIKDKSIDMLIDYSGTSNYSFENEEFLLKLIDKKIKDDSILLGGYILFDKFGINSPMPNNIRKNFVLKNIKDEIKSLGYKPIAERKSGSLQKGGKYESYFSEDEKVSTYGFYGKR